MSDVQASLARNDTVPKYLLHNAKIRGDKAGFREKEYGIWQSYSWSESAQQVRKLACGLAALGLKRGEMIAIIGDNRPHLYWGFYAAQVLGCIPVPLYQDSVADEMQFVLEHSGVRFALVENQEQCDKVMSVMDRCPALEQIIYKDSRGLRHYDESFLHLYRDVQDMGGKYDAENPDFFLNEVAEGKGSDVALVAYTSGTTGRPKGVMLSFDNFIKSALQLDSLEKLTADEEVLCYLPMAWVGDHFFVVQAAVKGFTLNCPESSETVLTDLREIGPTYYIAPPAIFEGTLTNLMIRMEDASFLKRKMFDYFIAHAKKVGADILDGKPVAFVDRLKYFLGNIFIYGPLRNNLGFSRVRKVYTGGAPLGPDTFFFYRQIGINLKQLYAQTECAAYATIQHDGDVRTDTVGPAAPDCEVRIDENGEVLIKSPGNFVGYFKNEEATAETLDAEGWLHTGDAGIMTDEGHLKIIDRAKDVSQLNDGTLFAPQFLENKLKFFPFIREAVAHGANRDGVMVFINIDLEAVGNWAERQNIGYSGYTDLAGHQGVYDLIEKNIEEVNQDLAYDSELSSSQIRRFLILHKELDADDGELTRTRKLRRTIIAERYGELIEALYSDKTIIAVEAKVTFEDGRTGQINADVAIRNVKIFDAMRKTG